MTTDPATRIAVVNPNTTAAMTDAVVEVARGVAREGTVVVGVTASTGVPTVESHVDEAIAALAVLRDVEALESSASDRPDAYVIACFGDTGLAAAREAASGPVVGMTEAALMTAALLAHRFTVITMPRRTMAMTDAVVRELGLGHRCVVRAVDEPVADVAHGSRHVLELFAAEAERALVEDSAEAILLGCAGLTELVAPLEERLGVPVIDGVASAVVLAEGLLAQGLATSRRSTWARPAAPTGAER